jgi:hypothetical protein
MLRLRTFSRFLSKRKTQNKMNRKEFIVKYPNIPLGSIIIQDYEEVYSTAFFIGVEQTTQEIKFIYIEGVENAAYHVMPFSQVIIDRALSKRHRITKVSRSGFSF